jgi:4-amino-4-deoxy-L-arabinose transferase-like glycosyltransferase
MPTAETLLEKAYALLEKRPLLAALTVFAVQACFTLQARALWYSDEIRHANVYQHVRDAGKWLVLDLNGQPYPDKPPVYFWLLRLLDAVTGIGEPGLFFLGAAVSAALLIIASWLLFRATLGDKRSTLAGLLALLASLFFLLITHYARMDLLFSALIIGSQTALYKAWTEETPGRWPMVGLGLAGVAVLTKGPLGLVFPLATGAVFLLWRGELRKMASRRMLHGALVCLGLLAAWLIAALIKEGPGFMHAVFIDQIYLRAVNSWHHKEPFQYYFIALPLAFLPWTVLLFFAPWRKVLSMDFWSEAWSNRREAGGEAYLWILFLAGFALLTSLSIKVLVYILPLLPPMAALAGLRLLRLDAKKARACAVAVGVVYLVLAIAAPFAEICLPFDISVQGLGFTTLILGGLGAWLVLGRPQPKSMLAGVVLGVTLWVLPAALLTAPSFDPVMSPKAQASLMGQYAEAGYAPAASRIYSGLYSYYAGRNITEMESLEDLKAFLASHPKAVVGVPKKYWERWRKDLPGLRIVHEQFIADRPYVLLLQELKAESPSTQGAASESSSFSGEEAKGK